MYIYTHTVGKKIFDPLLILYVCPLTKKLSFYNFNGRFIWTLRDRISTTKIQTNTFQKSYELICILMSQITIWPLHKTWLSTWWQTPCWQSQRSDVSCSWPPGLHTSQEGFCPTPLCRSSPRVNVSTSMYDGGDCVLGVIGSIPLPPNTTSWVDAKEIDFGLIWPQHFYPVLLWVIANFRRACTCAFLSRGTLRVLQDFSPSQRSVLPIVFLVTVVPAAFRSLSRSSCVILGWFLTVLMIIELHKVRSCMEPQTEGNWQLFYVSTICE